MTVGLVGGAGVASGGAHGDVDLVVDGSGGEKDGGLISKQIWRLCCHLIGEFRAMGREQTIECSPCSLK